MPGKIFDGVESFPPDRWRDLEKFRPRVLVGPAAELQTLAQTMARRAIELPSVDRALFVLSRLDESPANDQLRVVLWQTFAVPVYELLLGPGNKILAGECEAHEGWHPSSGVEFWISDGELLVDTSTAQAFHTGLTANITVEPCSCGRPGPRIVEPQRYTYDHRHPSRAHYRLAASA